MLAISTLDVSPQRNRGKTISTKKHDLSFNPEKSGKWDLPSYIQGNKSELSELEDRELEDDGQGTAQGLDGSSSEMDLVLHDFQEGGYIMRSSWTSPTPLSGTIYLFLR